ncbi:hypothetical protein HO173_012698 [Letharia columbiana]|uniref:F-box domain-containing protein n=1 Tax=Letharia columbiana TaxID=112416 RepID=A0A8H6CME5_9LECA|nr:uncharacterized protein HO173_012698 [Letharia columbiana]KAF6225926.1 hypothetical protein HO173_012698 [Letharia columbiana]
MARTKKTPTPATHSTRRRSSRIRLLNKRRTLNQRNNQRAGTPAAPKSSFSDLPAEIIIQVFKSVDDFSTAAALSNVSRNLFTIWKQDLPSICRAVLPRTVDCFDEAQDLMEAQSHSAQNQQSSDAIQATIGRAELFFSNAAIAWLASSRYERSVIDHAKGKFDDRGMTTAERTYFVKAWYRLMTIITLVKDFEPLPYGRLVSMDFLGFSQMMDVLHWLEYHSQKKKATLKSITLHNDDLRPYIALVGSQRWWSLHCLNKHLTKESFPEQGFPFPWTWTPFYTYVFHDHYPEETYLRMDVGLAQLFPSLPKHILEGILDGTVYYFQSQQ